MATGIFTTTYEHFRDVSKEVLEENLVKLKERLMRPLIATMLDGRKYYFDSFSREVLPSYTEGKPMSFDFMLRRRVEIICRLFLLDSSDCEVDDFWMTSDRTIYDESKNHKYISKVIYSAENLFDVDRSSSMPDIKAICTEYRFTIIDVNSDEQYVVLKRVL